MLRRIEAVVLGVLVLSTPRAGLAEEPAVSSSHAPETAAARIEAKRLSKVGLAEFAAGEYERAIDHFRAAYALVPAPILLYDIAQAERLSGHCQAAVNGYRRFLETKPAKGRELAEELLHELEPCAESEDAVDAPPAAEPAAVSPPRTPAPAPRPEPWLSPPVRAPVPRSPGAVDAARAHGKALKLALSFGSAGLLFAIAGYGAWRADRAAQRTSQLFARGGQWDDAAAATERDGRISSVLAWVAASGGLAATGVGVWVFAFD